MIDGFSDEKHIDLNQNQSLDCQYLEVQNSNTPKDHWLFTPSYNDMYILPLILRGISSRVSSFNIFDALFSKM